MTKRIFGLAAAFAMIVGVNSGVKADHIDYLTDGGFTLIASGGVSNSSTQTGNPGNILGSEREVTIDFLSGTSGFVSAFLDAPAGPTSPPGDDPMEMLLLSNSVNSAARYTLTYDGVGSAGLGGVDLTNGGAFDSVDVNFSGVQGSGDLMVSFTDTMGNTGSSNLTVNSAGTYSFAFSDSAYSGIDFTSIDSVVVVLETDATASDFAISEITRGAAVPEPSSIALTFLGAGCLLAARRRKVTASV